MIKVTNVNSLVLTNISFGEDRVESFININNKFIALGTSYGIEVYNKKMRKLNYKIPKQ